jgi:DNA-binding response OmpR family regulator
VPDILVASDADHVHAEVEAALASRDVTFRHLRDGHQVLPSIVDQGEPDLCILDLQIANMGGMATCMAIRLEEGADQIDPIPVIMLLDRHADVFLARRSRAEAWFVKPVNPIQLRACAERLISEADARWEAEHGVDVHGSEARLYGPEG